MSSCSLHRLPRDENRRLWRLHQTPSRRQRLCQGPHVHLGKRGPPLHHWHLQRADCVWPRARGGVDRTRHFGCFEDVGHGCGRLVGGTVPACLRAVAGGSGVAACDVAGSGVALAGDWRVTDARSGRGTTYNLVRRLVSPSSTPVHKPHVRVTEWIRVGWRRGRCAPEETRAQSRAEVTRLCLSG